MHKRHCSGVGLAVIVGLHDGTDSEFDGLLDLAEVLAVEEMSRRRSMLAFESDDEGAVEPDWMASRPSWRCMLLLFMMEECFQMLCTSLSYPCFEAYTCVCRKGKKVHHQVELTA